ncbi:TRAP transporter substrate-binding protein DctP [Novosphingobium taihuense]|uniref:TRAP-type C4-dicarboxylate transport system substrate-binding protein n=1 Tax=Novosphingobium taihuense TaxID=260085 RepID=A0A7W7ADL2_9SPHN|nr:TRAP transporter substrate-binding protein DctP [Novosphingobium taihuense]MBB4614951.1 TRAP-type C4-dicarboxylate transport system substrate-binding protein [Novosphingobium taihuense]TWH84608.1 TRAP-type C4-dicarboxylate transport system substrate-binding protein [Novosphingobium taihuense]
MRLFAALLILLLAACARPVDPGVTELTYASPYTPSHPFSKADQEWMAFVEKRSNGRIRIKPVWSGALLSSDMSMEELRHGVADIGLITPIYVRGGTHLLRIQTGFYQGADSVESQVALYGCIVDANPQVARELAGLKVLAVQGGTLPGVITANRQVRSLADIKGLRIRAPTELLSVLDSLGADPVNMPMGEVYSAMAKGVIDGVIAPEDTFKSLHFAEISKHFYQIAVPRGAYPARAMSEKRWNALSDADREVLNEGIAVWEAALARQVRAAVEKGKAEAVSAKVSFNPASAADQQRFDAIYLRDSEANARGLAAFGIDGEAAFRSARAAVKGRDRIICGSGS